MFAAGLSDVYRYGVRFVGYLLAVTLVGGVFIAGGAVAGREVFSSIVGSGSASGTGTAILAVALVVIGVLLLLSGLFGLQYKLIADATMAGVTQGRAPATPPESEDETAAGDDPEGGPAATPPGPEDGEATTEPTPADEPVPDRGVETGSVDDESPVDDEPTVDTAADDEPTVDSEGPTVNTGVDGEESSASETADPEEKADPWQTPDESTPSADAQSTAATGTDEASIDRSTGQGTAEGDSAGASEDDADGTEPEEWTPPDPSEFEPASEETGDDPRTTDDLFGEAEGDQTDAGDAGGSDLFSEDDTEAPSTDADEGDSEDATAFRTKSDDDPLSDALDES